jgi:xylulokinase
VSELFLGLDLGTSAVKLVAFDAAGRPAGSASRGYPTLHPADGMAELDPDLVWNSAVACFHDLAAIFREHRVMSLGVSAQGEGVIPVAADGSVLAPSPISADMRGVRQIAHLAERVGSERIETITGQPVSPLPSLAKVMWWIDEWPDFAASVCKYLCYGEFALLRLGLVPAIDESMASRTLAYDINSHQWSTEILEAAGLPLERLPSVSKSGSIAGVIPEAVAAQLCLPRGVVVVIGGHDQAMGALGAGVLQPGQVMYSIGTTEALVSVVESPNHELPRANIACYPHVVPGRYVALAGNQTGGRAIQWLGSIIGADARQGGFINELERAAEGFEGGPLFLAHLAGSGSVINDPHSSGAFHGLRFDTTRRQMLGAVLEGITFEQAIAVNAIVAAGIPVDELRAIGGGSRSAAWLAMKADILGRPIRRVAVIDAPCLAAAILGSVATGSYGSIEQAVSGMVRVGHTYDPRVQRRSIHMERLSRYVALYRGLSLLRDGSGV